MSDDERQLAFERGLDAYRDAVESAVRFDEALAASGKRTAENTALLNMAWEHVGRKRSDLRALFKDK